MNTPHRADYTFAGQAMLGGEWQECSPISIARANNYIHYLHKRVKWKNIPYQVMAPDLLFYLFCIHYRIAYPCVYIFHKSGSRSSESISIFRLFICYHTFVIY